MRPAVARAPSKPAPSRTSWVSLPTRAVRPGQDRMTLFAAQARVDPFANALHQQSRNAGQHGVALGVALLARVGMLETGQPAHQDISSSLRMLTTWPTSTRTGDTGRRAVCPRIRSRRGDICDSPDDLCRIHDVRASPVGLVTATKGIVAHGLQRPSAELWQVRRQAGVWM